MISVPSQTFPLCMVGMGLGVQDGADAACEKNAPDIFHY